MDLLDEWHRGAVRQVQVGHRHVGLQAADELHGFSRVSGLPHHGELPLGGKQALHRLAEDSVPVDQHDAIRAAGLHSRCRSFGRVGEGHVAAIALSAVVGGTADRKSTRLNSSHTVISYAVFCLKKKTKTMITTGK